MVRARIEPEDMIQKTNIKQHNMMVGAINDVIESTNEVITATDVNTVDIGNIKNDVILLSNEKLDKDSIDENIHFGPINLTQDGTNIIASLDAINPVTGVVTPLSFNVPGATEQLAGVMDASSVAWIADAESRISALEGLSDVKAVSGLSSEPTQAQLNYAWVVATSKQAETGDIIQDVNNAKLWVFVTDTWMLYGTLVVVPMATTTSIGGIKDTALNTVGNRWYCHVEADGRVALIGGDTLSTLVDTTIPGIQSGKQDKLTFDSTPAMGSVNPVTSGGVKTALDAKQDKLTFDNTPTMGSVNPVKSGGVKTALDGKQDKLYLYEHTIRVWTTAASDKVGFSLTILNQSSTVFTLPTLTEYLGSAADDFKQCSGMVLIGGGSNRVYLTGVRGGGVTVLGLEGVLESDGTIYLFVLDWSQQGQIADKVRQIV